RPTTRGSPPSSCSRTSTWGGAVRLPRTGVLAPLGLPPGRPGGQVHGRRAEPPDHPRGHHGHAASEDHHECRLTLPVPGGRGSGHQQAEFFPITTYSWKEK